MSVQTEVARGPGVAAARSAMSRSRSERLLAALRRAWAWLVLKRVDDPGAEQRDLLARTLLLAPTHWR